MKLLAATLLALAVPGSAVAALEVKLAVVPKAPVKGAPSAIQLRPYWTYKRADGLCCVLRPAAARYPFRLEAVSPVGRVYQLAVRRKSRYLWSAAFRFRAVGRW